MQNTQEDFRCSSAQGECRNHFFCVYVCVVKAKSVGSVEPLFIALFTNWFRFSFTTKKKTSQRKERKRHIRLGWTYVVSMRCVYLYGRLLLLLVVCALVAVAIAVVAVLCIFVLRLPPYDFNLELLCWVAAAGSPKSRCARAIGDSSASTEK